MTVRHLTNDELGKISSPSEQQRLLLHCCCAPCASYVLEYLSPIFKITVLFYNPNIQPHEEYDKRAAELRKLLALCDRSGNVGIHICEYDPACFEIATAMFMDEPEGGRRCRVCFGLRLGETAARAKEGGFDYFSTTLSVSPHKNAAVINEIGGALMGDKGINYLYADFKKRDGYKRSIELSKQFGLYRQSYCGCMPNSLCGAQGVRGSVLD